MKILMYIFTMLYLAGVVIGHYVQAIGDNSYFICLGLWAIMFILLNVIGEHNERW